MAVSVDSARTRSGCPSLSLACLELWVAWPGDPRVRLKPEAFAGLRLWFLPSVGMSEFELWFPSPAPISGLKSMRAHPRHAGSQPQPQPTGRWGSSKHPTFAHSPSRPAIVQPANTSNRTLSSPVRAACRHGQEFSRINHQRPNRREQGPCHSFCISSAPTLQAPRK